MTDLRTAAQQALEAYSRGPNWQGFYAAMENLRAALAQQAEQVEPVATITECEACFTPDVCQLRGTCDHYTASQLRVAAPPQLKQAEPVEPVAWRTFDGEGGYDYRTYEDNENYAAEWAQRNPRHVGWVEPLYTAPPQRKPLTSDKDRPDQEATYVEGYGYVDTRAVRAVERAHGIGEEK